MKHSNNFFPYGLFLSLICICLAQNKSPCPSENRGVCISEFKLWNKDPGKKQFLVELYFQTGLELHDYVLRYVTADRDELELPATVDQQKSKRYVVFNSTNQFLKTEQHQPVAVLISPGLFSSVVLDGIVFGFKTSEDTRLLSDRFGVGWVIVRDQNLSFSRCGGHFQQTIPTWWADNACPTDIPVQDEEDDDVDNFQDNEDEDSTGSKAKSVSSKISKTTSKPTTKTPLKPQTKKTTSKPTTKKTTSKPTTKKTTSKPTTKTPLKPTTKKTTSKPTTKKTTSKPTTKKTTSKPTTKKTTSKPTTKTPLKPTTKKTTSKPTTKTPLKPTTKKTTSKPTTKKTTSKPTTKKTTSKPTTKTPLKPTTKKTTSKPTTKKTTSKPTTKKTTSKPITKTPLKPTTKTPLKPTTKKTTSKPITKTPLKPTTKTPLKPTTKTPLKPTSKKTSKLTTSTTTSHAVTTETFSSPTATSIAPPSVQPTSKRISETTMQYNSLSPSSPVTEQTSHSSHRTSKTVEPTGGTSPGQSASSPTSGQPISKSGGPTLSSSGSGISSTESGISSTETGNSSSKSGISTTQSWSSSGSTSNSTVFVTDTTGSATSNSGSKSSVTTMIPSPTPSSQTPSPTTHLDIFINEVNVLLENGNNNTFIELQGPHHMTLINYSLVVFDGQTKATLFHRRFVEQDTFTGSGFFVLHDYKGNNNSKSVVVALFDNTRWTQYYQQHVPASEPQGLIDSFVVRSTIDSLDAELLENLVPTHADRIVTIDPSVLTKRPLASMSRCLHTMLDPGSFLLSHPTPGQSNNCTLGIGHRVQFKLTDADCVDFKNKRLQTELVDYIVNGVNKYCKCGMTQALVTDRKYLCGSLVFEAYLEATMSWQSSLIFNNYKSFVKDSSTVVVGTQSYHTDSTCFRDCLPSPVNPNSNNSGNVTLTVAIVVSCVGVFLIVVLGVIIYIRRKKRGIVTFRLTNLGEMDTSNMLHEDRDDIGEEDMSTFKSITLET